MVANGYLPPEADRWSDDEKENFVFRLFPPNWTQTGVRGIPADYLIIKGRRVPPSDPRYGEAIEQMRSRPRAHLATERPAHAAMERWHFAPPGGSELSYLSIPAARCCGLRLK